MSQYQESSLIPVKQYNRIMKQMPIASVEAVIQMDGGLLFVKRNNEPAKGEWWFPGGRIHKGENLEDTLRREVKEETGLEVTSNRLINVYSRVFPQRHDITVAYLCKCTGKIKLNKEHSEYLISKNIQKLHKYMQQTIKEAMEKHS